MKMLKKLCALACSGMLWLTAAPAAGLHAEAKSADNKCGENAYWSYEDGTLTITGTGMVNNPYYRVDVEWETANGLETFKVSKSPWFEYLPEIRRLVVEDGITYIYDRLFMNNIYLEEVQLPETLNYIGRECFAFCYALESVDLPESLLEIGQFAFQRCMSLTSVRVPAGVATLDRTFVDCFALQHVELNGEPGFYSTFASCTSLEEIVIPEGVVNLGTNTFSGCTALKKVTLPSTLERIGASCFLDCRNLTDIDLSDDVYIGSLAFYNCTHLVEEVDGFQMMRGKYVFSYERNDQKTVVIPEGVERVPARLFQDHTEIEAVVLPSSVQGMDMDWAAGCDNLRKITLPDEMEAISSFAFCRLAGLEEINIPSQCTCIGAGAFSECTALQNVTLPDTLTTIEGSAFAQTGLTEIVIPASCTSIADSVFDGCTALKKVTLPDTLTSIGFMAFENTGITELTIPEGVTEIGMCAFSGCEALEQLILPPGLKEIGFLFASGCTSLRQLTIPDAVTSIGNYASSGSGLASITLPETVEGIGRSAFEGCANLSAVHLPAQITELPAAAFAGCTSLETLALPAGLTSIGNGAFSGCTGLKSLTLPETLTTIGAEAFAGCSALEDITIPAAVTELGENAFQNAGAVREIDGCEILDGWLLGFSSDIAHLVIPAGVAQTAVLLSGRSETLQTVQCPASLRSIGREAFRGCTGLYELRLNDGLESIGRDALAGCEMLYTLTIPASVRQIGTQSETALSRIYGKTGSHADEFAHRAGIPFYDPDLPAAADLTLDYTKDGWSFGNAGAVFGETRFLTPEDAALCQGRVLPGGIQAGDPWNGSCFGLSVAVILAKTGRLHPDALQPGAACLAEVAPSEQVLSLINYYQCMQHSTPYIRTQASNESQAHLMYRLLEDTAAVKNGGAPVLLVYTGGTGSHAVVAYALESGEWEWNGRSYDSRVLLWDSNFTDGLYDEACLYYNTQNRDYIIPYYDVRPDRENAGLVAVCSDPDAICGYAHPLQSSCPPGDLNGDGAVTMADAVLLQRFLTESSGRLPLSCDCDLNADGIYVVDDLLVLLEQLKAAA